MLFLVIRGPSCSAEGGDLVVLGGNLDWIPVVVALVDVASCRVLCGYIGDPMTFDSVEL